MNGNRMYRDIKIWLSTGFYGCTHFWWFVIYKLIKYNLNCIPATLFNPYKVSIKYLSNIIIVILGKPPYLGGKKGKGSFQDVQIVFKACI